MRNAHLAAFWLACLTIMLGCTLVSIVREDYVLAAVGTLAITTVYKLILSSK